MDIIVIINVLIGFMFSIFIISLLRISYGKIYRWLEDRNLRRIEEICNLVFMGLPETACIKSIKQNRRFNYFLPD